MKKIIEIRNVNKPYLHGLTGWVEKRTDNKLYVDFKTREGITEKYPKEYELVRKSDCRTCNLNGSNEKVVSHEIYQNGIYKIEMFWGI